MKKEQVLGVVRHTLTFVGGVLIAKGIIDNALAQELIGATLTLIGGIWSVVSKND